ncbi:MAG: hypothetical protein ACYC0H_12795, partial [Solirubrobacteraceae bacterium]
MTEPISDQDRTQLRDQLLAACEPLIAAGPAPVGQERAWGKLLRDRLDLNPSVTRAEADARRSLPWPHWTRPPGPFDLLWSVETGSRAAVELKLGKPDELAWDLVKLADQTADTTASFAFAAICVQATPAILRADGGALLTEACSGEQRPVEWVKRWPQAW